MRNLSRAIILLFFSLAFTCPGSYGQTILFPIGSGPFGIDLDLDSNLGVVVNRNTNQASIINLADNTIKKSITVGIGPTSVAINPVTNRAVVTNFGSDNISVLDLSGESVIATIPVGKGPRDVAIDTTQNRAIVANLNGGSLSLIDLNTNKDLLTTPISVGGNPISVGYYPETNTALVANYQDNTVTEIDLATNSKIRDISVGINPIDIAIDAPTKRALVANSGTNDVTVLDLTDKLLNKVLATVPVGTRPFAVGINPTTNIAAVLSNGNKSISLINLSDNTKFTTVISDVGDNPTELAINPKNNTALVTNTSSDSVVVTPLGFLNYLPFALDTEQFRTNLGINNLSAAEADVELVLRDKDGKTVATGSTKVPAHGLKQINSVNQFLLNSGGAVTNTIASLKVMSDQPISSFISVIDNSTNDPGLQVGHASGFPKLLLNAATNVGAFRSTLVVLNLGNTNAALKLTARNNETGEVLGTKEGVLIAVNGFFMSQDVLADLKVSGKFGPIEIESPNLQPLIVVTLVTSDARTSGFLEAVPYQ
jgi:YVTN family beta-propeller protein